MSDTERKDLETDEGIESEQQTEQAPEAPAVAADLEASVVDADDPTPAEEPVVAEAPAEEAPREEALADESPVDAAEGEEADADGVSEEEPEAEPEPERDTSHMSWYVVHTYSGYENKARQALEERVKREKLEDDFGQLLIPTEEVVEISRGKRRTSKRKFFPGYMLVQMKLTEASWYLVKSTPKITGFVGNSTRPLPVPDSEIRMITNQIAEGADRLKPKIIFEKGDSVRVIDGPFANFNGTIDDVDPDKGKLRVLVSIFGRATPVEMDFVQVEKT